MATAETRAVVIDRIRDKWIQDKQLVVVVSAMGRMGAPYATDSLLSLIGSNAITTRERDLLLTCGEIIAAVTLSDELNGQGMAAEALTGAQAGIVTTEEFCQADVQSVDPARIVQIWESGKIAVVAGFQGQTIAGDLTTLGRGGSDTSAVVIGAALKCPVDIYTDVPGIFTADPRVVSSAAVLPEVAYHEVLEMASHGAKVIHPRAVTAARMHQVPVRVLSTFHDQGGTMIGDGPRLLPHGKHVVTGIAHQSGLVSLAVHADSSEPIYSVLDKLSAAGITIDMINLFGREFYCVIESSFQATVRALLDGLPGQVTLRDGVTKVTVVGEAISERPGVMLQITEVLSRTGIPILQTSDSLYTISLLVSEDHGHLAVNALHEFFGLNGVETP